MNFFLGIDFGTSGARGMVIDPAGQIWHQGSWAFAGVESAALAALWQASLFDLITQIPPAVRSQIRRLAINGTSGTVLIADAQGQPLDSPLLYNDARAVAAVEILREIVPAGHVVLSASSSLAKLLWWWDQGQLAQARYLMHQADWLASLLHGKPGISDYHNSLKLGYDPVARKYPAWFEHPHLRPLQPFLPQVLTPGTAIAPVEPAIALDLGLPRDCQVCAGTTDSIAAFLASGAQTPGAAVTSLGSTLVLKLLSHRPVADSHFGIYSHRFGDLWLVGGASNTGGAVLRKFFSDAELVQLSRDIDPQRESGLDYYPLLQPGERFPRNDPHLVPRLEPRPDHPVQFLQGLLESLSRIEAEGYQLLTTRSGTPLTQVWTAGGGAQNQSWMALRRRYLQVPVERSHHPEAAYGTARLALLQTLALGSRQT